MPVWYQTTKPDKIRQRNGLCRSKLFCGRLQLRLAAAVLIRGRLRPHGRLLRRYAALRGRAVSAIMGVLLSREKGINMRLGIVGLPNVGKSTLFNAITQAGAAVANYPFCTIEPNIGAVAVPDQRLGKLAALYHPEKVTSAVIEFVDIAGLVKGASKGEGLGNKFLANIREVDAIIHVVRCFDDPNVIHVDGLTDPARDIETVNLELILSDLEYMERRLDKTHKMVKGGDKKFLAEQVVLSACSLIWRRGNRPGRWRWMRMRNPMRAIWPFCP